MQEVPIQINWFNTSLSNFDYQTNADWTGFDFDDNFNQEDEGQLQNQPILLDEADLLKRLRKELTRDTPVIPTALFDFYDNCKNHFHLEFMALLKALIANVETAKKLEEQCKAGKLLNFYKFELSSKLNFGKHPICQDAATECNARLKQLIQEFGMSLQVETQLARNLTANELSCKLKTCGEDFLEFGKQEWIKQCMITSRFNILDQHFAVKGQRIEVSESPEPGAADEDEAVELRADPRSSPEITQFELFKMSTYLFSVAVDDSRKMVDKDIRNRRAQITSDKEKAANKKAVQHEVDLRADAIKPKDAVITLSQRFAMLDARIDELKKAQTGTEAQAPTTAAAQPTELADADDDHEQNIRRLTVIEERLRILETSDQAAKPHPSKNVQAADSAETQQSAHQARRVKKRRTEATTSEATTTTLAPTSPRMTTSSSLPPRPTTQNNVNGNAKQTNGRHPRAPTGQGRRGNDQNNGDARRTQDERQRPQSADRQSGQPRFQRGNGNGRGRGRGPARA
uniref:Uncharacterized protein n=1 Tax=Cryptomonas curvata TaxID=233186 RepID=A0A7S0MI93_9CRYP|mmetsp:Transcript_42634/g.89170  ORF Transcript_42634/g.89170 Transcript_42634/m.89170 type:complete len:515 (+) Transcript_42634:119-1663(+)